MKKLQERGFTALELILIVVVLAGIGFLGYKAYVNNQKANVDTAIKKQGTSEQTKSEIPDKNDQKYLSINEWSVKVPLDANIESLTYALRSNSTIGSIRSAALDKFSGSCKTNSVEVARGKDGELVPSEFGSDKETFAAALKRIKSQATANGRSVAFKIGDYNYVTPNYAGASCGTKAFDQPGGQAESEAETKAILDIVNALNKAEKL